MDSTGFRTVVESPSICRDCIVVERIAVLGDTTGPGFVDWTRSATRDSFGNYWVGQRGAVKVFDSEGTYLRDVGRTGGGPMEFRRPQPNFTDGDGRVHIIDFGNVRETTVGADFELHSERRVAGFFQSAAPLPGGERYAVSMLLRDTDQDGFPLHIVEGADVVHSFGIPVDLRDGRQAQFTSRRIMATDRAGHVFSAQSYDYVVEAWTETGRRITGFEGPTLNENEVLPEAFSYDNPPPNTIIAMRVDDAHRLWVISIRVKDDWRDRVVERTLPDGSVGLLPKDDSPRYLSTSRIEVIDLSSASIVARTDREEILEAFVGDGLGLETQYLESGIPQLVVWGMELVGLDDR